ncbi:NAD(P)/FAD-dependent oxidoreductase [Chitinibacter bivalviorum]|uniref:NAD(P)/FAD-dependent oxidoreductase n=1 Tax=Chitinibacter bivalviorum TaxID=2739434 RepID=A0A7H9BLQ5_9NEIS|nr:FAD-dependent oxidoreductase [Chitinibacter bivalviorum]QLG89523.1 NAD(P)/FAD-dependent oxidoreductase [Chitinibacter bivalviorum]
MSAHTQQVDALIVGGGVAGMTLALWLTGLARTWLIVEREAELGGCLRDSQYPLKWIPAFEQISGQDYVAKMRAQLDPTHCLLASEITTIERGDTWRCQLSNGHRIEARKIVFACGATPYSPYPPHPRLIVGPGMQKIAVIGPMHRVAVLGGGDNAFEHALILAERGCQVDLYCRSKFRASAVMYIAVKQSNIALYENTHLEQPSLLDNKVVLNQQEYDYACIYYGYQPSSIISQYSVLFEDQALQQLHADIAVIGDMNGGAFPNVLSSQGQAAELAKCLDEGL